MRRAARPVCVRLQPEPRPQTYQPAQARALRVSTQLAHAAGPHTNVHRTNQPGRDCPKSPGTAAEASCFVRAAKFPPLSPAVEVGEAFDPEGASGGEGRG